MNVPIETGYIKLDSFLKMIDAVSSGGEAKLFIAEGAIAVNGEIEKRRGRKLYPGDRVTSGILEYMITDTQNFRPGDTP